MQLHQTGKHADAKSLYEKILQKDPKQTNALHLLGLLCHQMGDHDKAIEQISMALEINPDFVEARGNLGVVFKALDRLDEAIEQFQKAITLRPDFAAYHYNLGSAFLAGKNFVKAIDSYTVTLKIDPDNAECHCNLGLAYASSGHLDLAETCQKNALRIKPEFSIAHSNLGIVQHDLGKYEDAADSYQKAISLDPKNPVLHFNLAVTQQALGTFDDAVASYENALYLDPQFADVHFDLSLLYRNQGDTNRASDEIQKALDLKPHMAGWKIRKAMLLPIIQTSVDDFEHRRKILLEAVHTLKSDAPPVADPLMEIGITSFYLAYHNRNNRPIAEAIAAMSVAVCPRLLYTAPHCLTMDRPEKQQLKLGILSTNLQSHTIGHLMKGLIRQFSRKILEVVVLRPRTPGDAVSETIDQCADRSVILSGKLQPDRRQISEEQFDILFYPDIGMSPYTYYMAFSRLAPVQVVSWGHPDTTGIANIDYFLSSRFIEGDGASEHYTEQLIRLQHLPTYYLRPDPPNGSFDRTKFGLSGTHRLYVCAQALFKLHPDFDEILGSLLARDEGGHLILINHKNQDPLKNLLLERFARTIPHAIGRIFFVPQLSHSDYLGLCVQADALLDTTTFSGGHSSQEAFAMGVPIVTMASEFMRGRVTAGCYHQMGLDTLIAKDPDEFVELALKLAQDPAFKAKMQQDIVANADKLFQRQEVVHEMEEFFKWAYDAWRRNEQPDPHLYG